MKKFMLRAAVAIVAAACGTTQGDRAASGGLIGAGAGAAIGSLSGNAGMGAVIGGLGGAVIGAAPIRVRYVSAIRSGRTSTPRAKTIIAAAATTPGNCGGAA
jgi:osmotically inducible lipoprotein OsmB